MSVFPTMRTTFSAIVMASLALPALAQQSGQTGTRIKGREGEQPTVIVRFDEPGELAAIRKLLGQNKIEDARELADTLLKVDKSPSIQYAGLNARCAIESKAGQFDKALEACDAAIRIRPLFWMALNSRGTVNLLAGRPYEALKDYETALASLPQDSQTTDLVRHNIELAKQRIGGQS